MPYPIETRVCQTNEKWSMASSLPWGRSYFFQEAFSKAWKSDSTDYYSNDSFYIESLALSTVIEQAD